MLLGLALFAVSVVTAEDFCVDSCKMAANNERTFIAVKPDGVQRFVFWIFWM